MVWRGKLPLNDSVNLAFYFRISGQQGNPILEIYNAEEVIRVDEALAAEDSLGFKLPVFDSELRFKYITRDSIAGVWINNGSRKKYRLNWSAAQFAVGQLAPEPGVKNAKGLMGKWEAEFNPGDPAESYKAVGIFRDPDCLNRIYGTFLTETGDYRFLSGTARIINRDTLLELFCFDGAHAFVFRAHKGIGKGQDLAGEFYSGPFGHEKWTARRNEKFELRNEDSLTFLKPGFDHLNFRFPGLEGRQVSLADDKYKGKVVILQVMGTWCPNCMDETKFLSEFYKEKKSNGLEVVALAFERTGDLSKAIGNVQRLKKRFDAGYDFLIAGTSSDRGQAARVLPELNAVLGFPTTIYIDKKGKVRKISTGFSGPATGAYYEKFVRETTLFVEKLLRE